MVRSVLFDRVNLRRGDDLVGLVPFNAAPTSLAAGLAVFFGASRIFDDRPPRSDRVFAGLSFSMIEIEQNTAHVRIFRPHRAVGIPGGGNATLATTRLIVRGFRIDLRPIGLLQLPRDQAVLDEHLPRTGPRAVDAMTRARRFVVGPAAAIKIFPVARLIEDAEPAGALAFAVCHRSYPSSVAGEPFVFSTYPWWKASTKGRKSLTVP